MVTSFDPFGSICLERGLITQSQLNRALEEQKRSKEKLGETLVRLKYLREDHLLDILAYKWQTKVVRLRDEVITQEALDKVPHRLAKKHHVVPLHIEDDGFGQRLVVAVHYPNDLQALDEIELASGMEVQIVVARKSDIASAISRHYEGQMATDVLSEITTDSEGGADRIAGGTEDVSDAGIIKLVNRMFREAVADRVSDVHVEPFEDHVKIRFRIDGLLQTRYKLPKYLQNSVTSRLKLLAGMDLSERRIPQDGRILIRMLGRDLDLRVSALPSLFGESVVMRILDKASVLLGLEDIGFLPDSIQQFESLIRRPYGILLITGPTGSGKTTTLYAALSTINTSDRKIITIENPVEYMLYGINQVQVHQEIGLTFGTGLRTILRQAPDVIMIGEIRDYETAEIAIRAALTGHLVFSTLHTNDAPSGAARLVDMGVKPFLVASSVQAIMAQRLVRRICPACREEYEPEDTELTELGLERDDVEGLTFYRGAGCEKCEGRGYRGRTAITELMLMNEELRHMVLSRESGTALKLKAMEHGMRTLREDGMEKVKRGITTISEVVRITQMDVA